MIDYFYGQLDLNAKDCVFLFRLWVVATEYGAHTLIEGCKNHLDRKFDIGCGISEVKDFCNLVYFLYVQMPDLRSNDWAVGYLFENAFLFHIDFLGTPEGRGFLGRVPLFPADFMHWSCKRYAQGRSPIYQDV